MVISAPVADVGALLGLTGKGARLVALLYAVTFIVLALTTGALQRWSDAAGLVAVLAAAVVLVAPGRYPLRWQSAVGVLAAVFSCTALVVWQLPATGDPGYDAWHFGACDFLLFALGLRGHIALSWLGMGLVLGVTCFWSFSVTGSILHGFELVYGHAGSLLAGSLFAYGLRRTAQRILDFQDAERRQAAAEQARETSAEHRDLELARVRSRAESALVQIATGTTTAAERTEHRLLEASLRDEIRGRGLAIEPVTTAAREARQRGVDVLLLDDSREQELPADLARSMATWVAALVRATVSDSVIVRLAPHELGLVATVATGGDSSEPEQLLLGN